MVWIFPSFIDSSEIKISNGSSSQIQKSKQFNFLHWRTDMTLLTWLFVGILSFFFSWREKKDSKSFYLKRLSFHVLLNRFKKDIWITQHKRLCGPRVCLQYNRSNTFLDDYSFLKKIKKTYFYDYLLTLLNSFISWFFSHASSWFFLTLAIPLLNAADLQPLRLFYWQFISSLYKLMFDLLILSHLIFLFLYQQ